MTGLGPQWSQALGHAASDKRLDILRGIARSGSISQAAREAGVSYKAAWQALDTLSNLAGVELVQRAVGGAGGGGARITEAGQWLLQAAAALDEARQAVLARLPPLGATTPSGSAPTAPVMAASAVPALSALGLRTSMRNQLPAQVRQLRREGAVVVADLTLSGGADLSARLTRESAQLLGLQAGLDVLALCKATAVRVGPVAGPGAVGALEEPANQAGVADAADVAHERPTALQGQVLRATRAGVAQEVVLALAGGLQLVGFSTPGRALRRGSQVQAWISPSAVVLALGA